MDPDLTPPSRDELESAPAQVRAAVRDHRPFPKGVLPRQLQTWIMVGLAVLILGVILMTGRPEPGPVAPSPSAAAATGPIAPARVQSYQERLAEQEARLLQASPEATPTLAPPGVPVMASPALTDPVLDERRQRDERSLFADNVAFTRRAGASPIEVGDGEPNSSKPQPASDESSATSALRVRASEDDAPLPRREPVAVRGTDSAKAMTRTAPAPSLETLAEGTVIETVLVNRLDGTFQGPVDCLVTTPVYSRNRQTVVIPAGARVLGSAAAIQAWGESRLAVRFHRLLLPDGQMFLLDSFPGLNQVGETGLKDAVDRHYLQVFGASLAIGAVAGFAQVGTRSGFDPSVGDAARQSAGGSLATSTARVLDRYLNVLPTVTIREGHRIKVVLTGDLHLPAYGPTLTTQGGF